MKAIKTKEIKISLELNETEALWLVKMLNSTANETAENFCNVIINALNNDTEK